MLTFFRAAPDVVRWELSAVTENGPYRLTIHHAHGTIVESFSSRTAALLRQGGLEDVLSAAWDLTGVSTGGRS